MAFFPIAFQPSCRNFLRFLSCFKTETFRLSFQPVPIRLLASALTGPLIAPFAISPSIIWLQCQSTFSLFSKCNASSCLHFRINRSSLCFFSDALCFRQQHGCTIFSSSHLITPSFSLWFKPHGFVLFQLKNTLLQPYCNHRLKNGNSV